MQNEPSLQQKIARGITVGLLIALTGWIALLIKASVAMRTSVGDQTYDIVVGPLSLTTISRYASSHGHTAVISPHTGLMWFVLVCMAIGGLLAVGIHLRTNLVAK